MRWILNCILSLLLLCEAAGATPVSFRHISTEEGLADVTVPAIIQDSEGYMWFAMQSGMGRYDGYSVRNFLSDDLLSKSTSFILSDRDGRIVSDFSDRLGVCDGKTIVSYPVPFGAKVSSLASLPDGSTLVLTLLGAYSFRDAVFSTIVFPEPLVEDPPIFAGNRSESSIIIISRSGAVSFFSADNSSVEKIGVLPEGISPKCLYFCDGTVWVGTEGQGLYGIRAEDGKLFHLTRKGGELPSDFVRSVCDDPDGKLLIGTLEGFSVRSGETCTIVQNKSDDPSSLSYNSVRSICRDRNGGMWLGTYYGGVNYYHREVFSFRRIASNTGPRTSDDNVVSSIALDDADGSVWMGFGHIGLARYVHPEDRLTVYPFPKVEGRTYDVKSILPDPVRGRVWVGSRLGGFGYLDRSTGEYNSLPIPVRDVFGILEHGRDSLLLFTDRGLMKYDVVTGTVRFVAESKINTSVGFLWCDSSGEIWTSPVLNILRDDGLGNFISDSSHPLAGTRGVQSFYENSSGIIYIPSNQGLQRYDPRTGEVRAFGKEEGLPAKIVEIIGEDRMERLWLGLTTGVCCFNAETGAFQLFGKAHGFSPNWYIQRCSCILPDGTFCIGTLDGLVTFHPEHIGENSFSPSPVVTSVRTGEHDSEEDISSGSLTLPHDRTSISFTFATFNYMSAGNERFACILEGAEKDWRYIDRTNTISYTTVPPGKYTFRVRAANADGIWAEEEARIEVTIRPDLFRSPLFRVSLALVLLMTGGYTLYSMIRQREKRIRLQERRKALRQKSTFGIEHRLTQEEAAFLEKAKAIVEDNISNISFTVDDFAREMGISRAGLYTKVKLVSGCSPMDLLMEERWKVACRLLKESSRSVADIAEYVGFSTASYFTRAFKKRFGVLPSVYRKG